MSNEHPTPEAIMQLTRAYAGSKALVSAAQLGLLTTLADGPLTGEVLRAKLGLQPRGTTDWLAGPTDEGVRIIDVWDSEQALAAVPSRASRARDRRARRALAPRAHLPRPASGAPRAPADKGGKVMKKLGVRRRMRAGNRGSGWEESMRVRRTVAAGAISVLGAVGAVAAWGTGTALAYGNDAVHQVEISASLTPNPFGPGTGGGIWLWIELDGTQSGGDGDYTGSDCLHRTPIEPSTGAVADHGDVTWTSDGSTITITGVVIGGNTPVTITVPESGHESVSLGDVFQGLTPPGVPAPPGTAQVQVAP